MPEVEGTASAKRLVTRWYEQMWNRWDESVVAQIAHPDVSFRGSLGQMHTGHEGIVKYMRFVQSAFPDFHNRIDLLIAEWPNVFAKLTYTGTHKGEILGIKPTERRIEYAGAAVFSIRDGLLHEVWVLGDLHALRQQIGS